MDKGVGIVRFLGLFGWILCSGFGTCSGCSVDFVEKL